MTSQASLNSTRVLGRLFTEGGHWRPSGMPGGLEIKKRTLGWDVAASKSHYLPVSLGTNASSVSPLVKWKTWPNAADLSWGSGLLFDLFQL